MAEQPTKPEAPRSFHEDGKALETDPLKGSEHSRANDLFEQDGLRVHSPESIREAQTFSRHAKNNRR